MKKVQSLLYKKGLLMYLSSIKTKLAINFLKKNFCTWRIGGLALKGLGNCALSRAYSFAVERRLVEILLSMYSLDDIFLL